jgi:hypothetical protein
MYKPESEENRDVGEVPRLRSAKMNRQEKGVIKMSEEQKSQAAASNAATPPNPPSAVPPNVVLKRDEDFTALYANNVLSEASAWDLKVIFGILDQSVVPNQIVQHTSINLPWTQVKLQSYYIKVALAIQEFYNGKINIPAAVIPINPEKLNTPETQATPQELRDKITQIYKDFISSL